MLFERTLMRSTLCGVLTIDETMIFLTILIGMRESDFYIFSHDMHNRIKSVVRHVIVQQIGQTIAAFDATTVIHNRQSTVQIGVVTEHCLHNIIVKTIVLEERIVGFKVDIRTVFVVGIMCFITLFHAFFEYQLTHFSIAE